MSERKRFRRGEVVYQGTTALVVVADETSKGSVLLVEPIAGERVVVCDADLFHRREALREGVKPSSSPGSCGGYSDDGGRSGRAGLRATAKPPLSS